MNQHDLTTVRADILENLAASVGLDSFYISAFTYLELLVAHDMHWAITYSRKHRPEVHLHKVIADPASGISRKLIRDMYEAGYYRFDPFYRNWRDSVTPGVVRMMDIVKDKTDDDYIKNFMPLTGVEDDVVLFCQISEDFALGLCLERRNHFLPEELETLNEVFPLINGLARSHNRIVKLDCAESSPGNKPPINFGEAFMGFLPDVLTPRERQIVRLVLIGFDNAAISRRLSISVGTVKNHRKRIHVKADITSERELFSLFLGYLANIEPSELALME